MTTHELTRGTLRARPGDRLVIRGHHLGERERDGEILEVLGEDGLPPFLVRWSDDDHVSRLRPGSDAYVEHFERQQAERWDDEDQEAHDSGRARRRA